MGESLKEMIYKIVFATILSIVVAGLQSRDFKSSDPKIRRNAIATIVVTIILYLVQLVITIEQNSDNEDLNGKVSRLETNVTSLRDDSTQMEVRFAEIKLAIDKSNLKYDSTTNTFIPINNNNYGVQSFNQKGGQTAEEIHNKH